MHYRNGRKAENGDKIIQLSFEGGKVEGFGILHDAVPGNNYCNGQIATPSIAASACLCDCIHVDDLAAILAANGLDKRPEGK